MAKVKFRICDNYKKTREITYSGGQKGWNDFVSNFTNKVVLSFFATTVYFQYLQTYFLSFGGSIGLKVPNNDSKAFLHTVVAKKDETTLLVKLLTKSFHPFWPPL